MKNIKIKRNNLIRSGLLIVVGILFGALIFSSSGEPKQLAANSGHNHQQDTTRGNEEQGTVWTCSMHPQVRQNEPGDCPICGMELIPAEETEGKKDPTKLKMTEEALKLADIQTSGVSKRVPSKEIRLTGKIAVDQRSVYTQSSHFPGRIERLHLNFLGEYVEKGQTIATVYSSELISAQEELLEALKTKESNPRLLEAAREKLRQWKLSEEQIRNIEQKGEVTEHMEIKANVSGIVHKKMVNEGDYVQKGSMLYHIAKIDSVWVMFDAYQEDVPLINEGDQINFTVSSVPGKTFTSTVTFIDPLMDEKSRVARVRAEADNQEGLLKPGMFAEGVMNSNNVGTGEELVIPSSSVMWTGKRSVVYVKQPNRERPTFELREVLLGTSLGDSYIVQEGLESNEEIVTHGTFAVDAAAQLAGKPSMMNQEMGKPTASNEHQAMAEMTGQSSTKNKNQEEKISWPESQSEFYKSLINHYMSLKDELVNDTRGEDHANKMIKTLAGIEMKAFSNEAHTVWMDLQKTIQTKARAIAKAEKLEEQRTHFIALSDAMIRLAKTFQSPDGKLFVQFCPMANDNKGAFWLSLQDEVRNPYYGDQMLTCGEVREEINGQ